MYWTLRSPAQPPPTSGPLTSRFNSSLTVELLGVSASQTPAPNKAPNAWSANGVLLEAPDFDVAGFGVNPAERCVHLRCTLKDSDAVDVPHFRVVTNGNGVGGFSSNQKNGNTTIVTLGGYFRPSQRMFASMDIEVRYATEGPQVVLTLTPEAMEQSVSSQHGDVSAKPDLPYVPSAPGNSTKGTAIQLISPSNNDTVVWEAYLIDHSGKKHWAESTGYYNGTRIYKFRQAKFAKIEVTKTVFNRGIVFKDISTSPGDFTRPSVSPMKIIDLPE